MIQWVFINEKKELKHNRSRLLGKLVIFSTVKCEALDED